MSFESVEDATGERLGRLNFPNLGGKDASSLVNNQRRPGKRKSQKMQMAKGGVSLRRSRQLFRN